MVTHLDPFMLNTNLNWNGTGLIAEQLKGNAFGVDGRAVGKYIAETTNAQIVERSTNPNDPQIDDLDGNNVQDRITVGAGSTLASKSGLLDYVLGVRQYSIELIDGTILTQADFRNEELPLRILDPSTNRKVILDFSDTMLSKLSGSAPVAKISFPNNVTTNRNYGSYTASSYDGSYTPVCFTSGTLIETACGLKAVEDLCCGDEVKTLDNGYQQICWIGSAKLDKSALQANLKLLPVEIKAGALGQGLPIKDLTVSRQHRVLIRSKIAQRMFGSMEILIPAIKLVELEDVQIAKNVETVTYWHILFNRHEIIFSNGAPTESLFLGEQTLNSIPEAGLAEIKAIFSEEQILQSASEAARFIPPTGKEVKKLISRHVKKEMPVL